MPTGRERSKRKPSGAAEGKL